MKCGHCRTEGVGIEHVRQCSGTTKMHSTVLLMTGVDKLPMTEGLEMQSGRLTNRPTPFTPSRGESLFDQPQADEPPSTEAQRGYITRLRGFKGLEPLAFTGTKRQASAEIDRLKAMPDAPKAKKTNVAVPEGIYRHDGDIYKVQISHYGESEGFAYAKKLVLVERTEDEMHPDHPEWTHKGEWERATGMQYRLKEADRMHVEVARQYGVLYGFCVRCGRILEREDSIERGMGPKCAAKMEGE